MLDKVIRAYSEAVYDTDREQALKIVHDAVEAGVSPEDIVFGVVVPAMDTMAKSMAEEGGASLAQHYMAAQIADTVTTEMVERFEKAPTTTGHVVVGTARGDLHSLGKRIVMGCLRARMMEVTDLGVNVAPEAFVDGALAHGAEIIAISSMMIHTACGPEGPLAVRRILHDRGLEARIRIIVGGAPYHYDHGLWKEVGADAWADDGVTAGKVIADLTEKVRS